MLDVFFFLLHSQITTIIYFFVCWTNAHKVTYKSSDGITTLLLLADIWVQPMITEKVILFLHVASQNCLNYKTNWSYTKASTLAAATWSTVTFPDHIRSEKSLENFNIFLNPQCN